MKIGATAFWFGTFQGYRHDIFCTLVMVFSEGSLKVENKEHLHEGGC